MITEGVKVRIVCSPRPESLRFIGRVGEVRGPVDSNGVFEVRFYNAGWSWLPPLHRFEGVYADASMVEIVMTGLEKEFGPCAR